MMSERLRLTGILGGYLVTLLRQGLPRVGSPGPHPGGFWRSPRKRSCSISAVSLPVLHYSHSTQVLPSAQGEPPVLQFVPVSSDLGTGHHGAPIFSAPSSQVFIYSNETSLSLFFTRLNGPSSLTLSLCVRCFLVMVLNGPLLDSSLAQFLSLLTLLRSWLLGVLRDASSQCLPVSQACFYWVLNIERDFCRSVQSSQGFFFKPTV